MRMRRLVLCAIVAFLAVLLICSSIRKRHTFTLSNSEGTIKAEQIQPLRGTVKVSGDCDTDVVFTDVETGIKLENNKWYKVEGEGNLTMSPVNVRVE